jgi:hypothetical protein
MHWLVVDQLLSGFMQEQLILDAAMAPRGI